MTVQTVPNDEERAEIKVTTLRTCRSTIQADQLKELFGQVTNALFETGGKFRRNM